MFDPTQHPHRRYNPLLGEYVLVSPHRMKRPWQGKQESVSVEDRPTYDPNCYLCPGNTRKSGAENADYEAVYVFENDFRALLNDVPEAPRAEHPLLQTQAVSGTNRVICFSPKHNQTLTTMPVDEIRTVIDLWSDQTAELGRTYQWVQVFENRGAMMGSSNPHPHGQIWAENVIPNIPAREDQYQKAYLEAHGSVLLLDYANLESKRGERTIAENASWIAVVPFWAIWPFEVLLLPKWHVTQLPHVKSRQRGALADILQQILVRYDNLFEISFPYSMGWHGAPFTDGDSSHWQLHAHFYPPLLRSATVRKFMVGYEMLGESQRDLTAEQAAERLRSVPGTHYTQKV